MIHYHGTPITPHNVLIELMSGRHLTISFARPDQVKIAHQIAQSVMLDNGAFSFWTRGEPINWKRFYRWCEPWLQYYTTWAVIPDVIDGGEEVNDQMIAEWPFGHRGVPVWHLHESLDRLKHLCNEWPRVCIGSSGTFSRVKSESWYERMNKAFSVIVDENGVPKTWLHMLRGLQLAWSKYPVASADSAIVGRKISSWLKVHSLQEVSKRITRMDGLQPPPTFSAPSIRRLSL